MDTTVGQILINQMLPRDMQDHDRVLDKKNVKKIFTELAERYPDRYSEINQKFHALAQETNTTHGGQASLSLDSLKAPDSVIKQRDVIRAAVDKILAGSSSEKQKNEEIIKTIVGSIDSIEKSNYDDALRDGNPMALQVFSGARGNKSQLRSTTAGDMLVVDHKERPIPIPILSSYAEGLDPVQYWAGTYGARRGALSTKFATPKSGFLGKQLAMATHRIMVTEKDCGTQNHITVDAADNDSSGAVLANDAGQFKAGTVLTPRMLKSMGEQKIQIRSPLTCQSHAGICQRCAGVRERGGFPPIGDNVGIAAAQAIAEPIGQSQLSAKHGGGVAGNKSTKSGMDLVNQLVQVPSEFKGGAAIAQADGKISRIEDAPQGGQYVYVGDAQHWMPSDQALKVKMGDVVEAGDVLSDGIPNPALIVQHKGIGDGRRYFVDQMHQTLKEGGFEAHRRNIELLARGLINHVRVTDLYGPNHSIMDDVIEYDSMAPHYEPRAGTSSYHPSQAVGKYLERPAAHYSIGTRITPRVANTLKDAKIPLVDAHNEPPSFAPEMTRAMETLSHSDDWMVRMGGFGLKKGLMESVHRNRSSDLHGTSFIPALAQGTEFGKPPPGVAGY